ncbi:MAG TPA: aldehyde dehydrogenase family protein [Acidimicrobiia bacterium]|jgi:acyl-CoA reductase-like NAD-dependent aldehyde dehydrogenase|nr:aldehyde dehydrogenase family protein [Acidimicrobiia bacterium]
MSDYFRNYINGQWVDGSNGERIVLEDPATAEPFAEAARATPEDVDAAVAAARACVAERSLTDMRPSQRGRMLVDMARWLREREDEITALLTRDSGKTLQESGWELAGTANFLEYYGGLTDKLEGSYIPLGAGYTDYVMPVPYGVSAHIIPWNYPLEITGRGIAPALAAGNAVVVKSPELDPATVTYIAHAAEAVGMPPGAVNVVCGYGHDAGDALAQHAGVNQITFTGSVATGQKVLHAAAESVIPAVVELGGKSAGIVLPDADLDNVTEQTRWGIFSNSGQVCSALSRLVVPDGLHDEIVDRVIAVAEALDVGPGASESDMGPLISRPQLERVDRYVKIAGEDGAVAAAGGSPVPDTPGHFYEPTVFVNVTNDMTIAREEVFGPVLSIIRYSDTEDALAIANDSEYGLVAGVFGNDLEQATYLADRLEAGQVFVNEWFQPSIEAPFGGFKKSGFGREKGRAAMGSYHQWKNVAIRRP